MSVQEIERQIERLTPREQAEVETFLKALRRVGEPAFQKKIAQGHREIEAGRYVTLPELRRLLGRKPVLAK